MMSKMSELVLEIEERLDNGDNPKWIAKVLNVPLDWVLATEANMVLDNKFDQSEFDSVGEF